jgi:hypothetical protein
VPWDTGGMYKVELYARVRRAVAREFGLARKTVEKMLEYALPPGYQRQKPIRRPKLGPRAVAAVAPGLCELEAVRRALENASNASSQDEKEFVWKGAHYNLHN